MLLDDISLHLQASGIGIVDGNIFKSQLADSPDVAVGVFEYPGRPSDKTFGTTIVCENPRFQILVRSAREGTANAYATARQTAETIYRLLDGAGDLTLSGTKYLYIEALQPPSGLQRDENGRWIIAANFEARKMVG